MSRVSYFLLSVTLIFQHFTILLAISPAPTPGPSSDDPYVPSPTPTYVPTPTPSPSHHNTGGSPPISPAPQSAKSKGSSKGMSGGQKAGLTFGVIAGAALLGFAGMVYAKRRNNIQRSRNIDSVQLGTAFVRRPSP